MVARVGLLVIIDLTGRPVAEGKPREGSACRNLCNRWQKPSSPRCMRSQPRLHAVRRRPETEEPLDDRLMALAARGSRAAFTQIVARHERSVRSLCLLLIRDEGHSWDLAQEVFLRAWEQCAKYRPSGKLKVWLLTLARNLCRSHWRRLLTLQFLGLDEAPESASATANPQDDAIERERRTLLLAGLAELPERFRVPLSLRFLEGMDYDAIAEVIGRTPSAARSRVHYGLVKLERRLPRGVFQ